MAMETHDVLWLVGVSVFISVAVTFGILEYLTRDLRGQTDELFGDIAELFDDFSQTMNFLTVLADVLLVAIPSIAEDIAEIADDIAEINKAIADLILLVGFILAILLGGSEAEDDDKDTKLLIVRAQCVLHKLKRMQKRIHSAKSRRELEMKDSCPTSCLTSCPTSLPSIESRQQQLTTAIQQLSCLRQSIVNFSVVIQRQRERQWYGRRRGRVNYLARTNI